jgi:hypothetical protein
MQRKDKEQRIEQIYKQISVIIGNWKNQLKSHGVSTQVTLKRNTKTMLEKQNNQPL